MNGQYLTSFDGAKIYYHKTIRDKDKWLIFLHGFGGDLTAWQKEREYFDNQGFSTIAMDLRGHGFSERSNNKDFYKLENFAKDVVALLQKENLSNTVVIGHCFGGMVSIYFQAQFPHHSKGLVLVDTGFKPPFLSSNPVEKTFLTEMLELLLKITPNLQIKGHADFKEFIHTGDLNAKRILSDILHTSLQSYLTICENLVGMNIESLLSKILVPALVIEGLKDTVFPPKVAQYLHQRIKKSELDLIPEANHIIVLNDPEDLEQSISNFLTRINFA